MLCPKAPVYRYSTACDKASRYPSQKKNVEPFWTSRYLRRCRFPTVALCIYHGMSRFTDPPPQPPSGPAKIICGGREWSSGPAAHKCCLCPSAPVTRRRRRCFTFSRSRNSEIWRAGERGRRRGGGGGFPWCRQPPGLGRWHGGGYVGWAAGAHPLLAELGGVLLPPALAAEEIVFGGGNVLRKLFRGVEYDVALLVLPDTVHSARARL